MCIKNKIKQEKPLKVITKRTLKSTRFDEYADCSLFKLIEKERYSNNYVSRNQNYTMKRQEIEERTLCEFGDKRFYSNASNSALW